MKFSAFGNLIATSYTDRMSINRYAKFANSDGTTGTELPDEPLYDEVPCRISFTQTDNPESGAEDVNPIYLQIKVFCATATDVTKGDFIQVERLDDAGVVIGRYKGTVNLPLVYTTHKEILFAEIGEA